MEQFVAGLSVDQLAHIVVGASPGADITPGVAGTTTALYESLGIPSATLVDGPAGIRILQSFVEDGNRRTTSSPPRGPSARCWPRPGTPACSGRSARPWPRRWSSSARPSGWRRDEHPPRSAQRPQLRVLLRRPPGLRPVGHLDHRRGAEPTGRGSHRQALRRQPAGEVAPALELGDRRAGPARDLPQGLRDRREVRTAHGRHDGLQPPQRNRHLGQLRPVPRTSCAASGATAASS